MAKLLFYHSPLIIDTHFLSLVGAALPRRKANARAVVPLLQSSYFFVYVYPGFHFGLCPHSPLGYEEVSCLKALAIRLNFDAVALNILSMWQKNRYFA